MTDKLIEQVTQELQDTEFRLEYGEEIAKVDFALALIQARKAHNVTQIRLAEILGVRQPYIAKLERGEANPSIATAGRIFGALWDRLSWIAEPLCPTNSLGASQGELAEPLTAVEDNTASSIILPLYFGAVENPNTQPPIRMDIYNKESIWNRDPYQPSNLARIVIGGTADGSHGDDYDIEKSRADEQTLVGSMYA